MTTDRIGKTALALAMIVILVTARRAQAARRAAGARSLRVGRQRPRAAQHRRATAAPDRTTRSTLRRAAGASGPPGEHVRRSRIGHARGSRRHVRARRRAAGAGGARPSRRRNRAGARPRAQSSVQEVPATGDRSQDRANAAVSLVPVKRFHQPIRSAFRAGCSTDSRDQRRCPAGWLRRTPDRPAAYRPGRLP